MLPLSHTYVSTKVTGKKGPLLVFGSVLPDMAWISLKGKAFEMIHHSPKDFYSFLVSRAPDLVDLAIGVRLHSNIDRGADFYSDDNKVGFAVVEGKKIQSEAGKLLKTDDVRLSLVLAHNFIEAGVDLNLLERYPEILNTYKFGLSVDLDVVSGCVAEYLCLDMAIVREELGNFVESLSPMNLSSEKNMVNGVLLPIVKIIFKKQVDAGAAQEVLAKAKEITKNTAISFLDGAVREMRKDFVDSRWLRVGPPFLNPSS